QAVEECVENSYGIYGGQEMPGADSFVAQLGSYCLRSSIFGTVSSLPSQRTRQAQKAGARRILVQTPGILHLTPTSQGGEGRRGPRGWAAARLAGLYALRLPDGLAARRDRDAPVVRRRSRRRRHPPPPRALEERSWAHGGNRRRSRRHHRAAR